MVRGERQGGMAPVALVNGAIDARGLAAQAHRRSMRARTCVLTVLGIIYARRGTGGCIGANGKRRIGMTTQQRNFLVLSILATWAAGGGAIPALGQTATPAQAPISAGAGAGSIPDFSGIWVHPTWPSVEPPLAGPGPVRNRSRLRTGESNGNQLVGDYTNPTLKPHKGIWRDFAARRHLPDAGQSVLAATGALHLLDDRHPAAAGTGQGDDPV
jgi:hypothetical protein